MPTDTPLTQYLRLQRALDRDVLASLRVAAASVEGELRRLQGRTGIGNQMRAAQLAASQAAINREMASHWTRVGNITAAHQANAAADAAEAVFRASPALSSVFDPADLDYMTRSVRASAQQGLQTAMERVSGSSYVPLAESVYQNAALTSGTIDNLVNAALTRGASAAELARDVRGFVNPNTPGGARYASMRLARTELNNAFHASQVRQAQQNPWTTGVKWNLSGSHPVPDECNQYAEQEHFDGGDAGVFKPGEVPGKPHPQCLCYTTTVDDDVDEFIRKFEAGELDTYLDENFPDLPPSSTVRPVLREQDARNALLRDYDANPPTESQLRALDGYQGNDYGPLNTYFRTGQVATSGKSRFSGEPWSQGSLETLSREIDSTLQPVTEDFLTHRATTLDSIADLDPGVEWHDPGYLSTTLKEGMTSGKMRDRAVYMHVTVRQGVRGKYLERVDDLFGPGEQEFLLARNVKMRVTSIEERDGKTHVYLEAKP